MASFTLTLPADPLSDLRARVAAGQYPDEATAVTDALRSAFEHDPALENRARTEAFAALVTHNLDPGAAIPVEDVMQELDCRRSNR